MKMYATVTMHIPNYYKTVPNKQPWLNFSFPNLDQLFWQELCNQTVSNLTRPFPCKCSMHISTSCPALCETSHIWCALYQYLIDGFICNSKYKWRNGKRLFCGKEKNSQRNAFTLLPYLCFCITQQFTAQQANLSHLCLVHMIAHAHPPLDTWTRILTCTVNDLV